MDTCKLTSLGGLQGVLSILGQTRKRLRTHAICPPNPPALPESHPCLICCHTQPDLFPFPFGLGVGETYFMEGRTKSALRDRLRQLSPVQRAVGSEGWFWGGVSRQNLPIVSQERLCSLHLTLEVAWGSRQGPAMSPWPIQGLDYFFIKFVIIEKCKSFATARVKQAVEVKAFFPACGRLGPHPVLGKGEHCWGK